jgi:hypothetical protein
MSVPSGERVPGSGVAELFLLVGVLWEVVSCLGVEQRRQLDAGRNVLTSAMYSCGTND